MCNDCGLDNCGGEHRGRFDVAKINCTVCGADCETIYISDKDILGCDTCITKVISDETVECEICAEETQEIFQKKVGNSYVVVGCECCVKETDVQQWHVIK